MRELALVTLLRATMLLISGATLGIQGAWADEAATAKDSGGGAPAAPEALRAPLAGSIFFEPDVIDLTGLISPPFGPVQYVFTTEYDAFAVHFSVGPPPPNVPTAVFSDPPVAWGGVNAAGIVDLIASVDGQIVRPGTGGTRGQTSAITVEAGFAQAGNLLLETWDCFGNPGPTRVNGLDGTGPNGRLLMSISAPISAFRVLTPAPGGFADTFGVDSIELDSRIRACVIDHFKLYELDDATELDPEPVVNLLDQFGPQLGVEVEEAEFFGNPVKKIRDGDVTEINNPDAHLTCYEIEDGVDEPKRRLTIDNQFGEQTLVVEEAELLCLPTLKIAVDGKREDDGVDLADLDIDHFKFYEVDDAEKLDLVVDLFDQFHEEGEIGVKVKKAKFFGNPVDKNGEGIINEVDHLTCYEIEDDGDDEERTLEIVNQFGPQTLEAEEAELLCVPTQKIEVVVIEKDDDDDDDDD